MSSPIAERRVFDARVRAQTEDFGGAVRTSKFSTAIS